MSLRKGYCNELNKDQPIPNISEKILVANHLGLRLLSAPILKTASFTSRVVTYLCNLLVPHMPKLEKNIGLC